MKFRIRSMVLPALVFSACMVCVFLGIDSRSQSRQIMLLQGEVSRLNEVQAENEVLQKVYLQSLEVERLKKNREELRQLLVAVEALQKNERKKKPETQAAGGSKVQLLERENQQLRQGLDQLKAAPATVEARAAVDMNQLRLIGQMFQSYAKKNGGKFPKDFGELKFYLAADVYPGIETNRFEILAGKSDAIDPGQNPVVRSKIPDDKNLRAYLFADGHLEMRGEE